MFRKIFQNQIRNVSLRNFRSTFKPGQEYETIKLERKGQLSGRVLCIGRYAHQDIMKILCSIVRFCDDLV